MALILSLETSSEVCSVCLHDDLNILALVETSEPFSHTRKITVFIQECFKAASKEINELEAVAISHGPGSYTGLRVAAATAKGICYGLNIPLIAVDTLSALADYTAKGKAERRLYIPMIDARRMEVYHKVLDADMSVLQETDNIILEEGVFDAWKQEGNEIVLCGTGVEKSRHLFQSDDFVLEALTLSAKYLVPMATLLFQDSIFENLVAYEPNYFKAPKVTQSKKKRF